MPKSTTNKSKPNLNRAIADRSVFISYTNIGGLRTNFSSVESFPLNQSPDILALSETGLNSLISNSELNIPGYSPIITKHDPLSRHGHGLGVYIKIGLPCGRDTSYEDADSPFMCFRHALLHSTGFILTIYRPQDNGCDVIDTI